MSTIINTYLDLITSEHADKPNFNAVVGDVCQPFVDLQNVYDSTKLLFDVTTAIGDQLDKIGEWVGVSRYLSEPLSGVYFSWDIAGLGWDQSFWVGTPNPIANTVVLTDTYYRLLLAAKILNNNWDGTINSAYALAEPLFNSFGLTLFIVDNGDMTIDIGLSGTGAINPVVVALLEGGYLDIKPAGIQIKNYLFPTSPGGPIFAFGIQNSTFAGFGTGVWVTNTLNAVLTTTFSWDTVGAGWDQGSWA